jgi:hypothetical protein
VTWTDWIGTEVGLAAIIVAAILGFAVLAAAWPMDGGPGE